MGVGSVLHTRERGAWPCPPTPGSTSRSSGRCCATTGENAQKGSAPACQERSRPEHALRDTRSKTRSLSQERCLPERGAGSRQDQQAVSSEGSCTGTAKQDWGAISKETGGHGGASPENPRNLVMAGTPDPPFARACAAARPTAPKSTLSVAPCCSTGASAASPPPTVLPAAAAASAGGLPASASFAAADECRACTHGWRTAQFAAATPRRAAAAVAAGCGEWTAGVLGMQKTHTVNERTTQSKGGQAHPRLRQPFPLASRQHGVVQRNLQQR